MSDAKIKELEDRIAELEKRIQRPSPITPKPGYDFVPPATRGAQCGQCGMIFEHGLAYGYYCGQIGCPMGCGPIQCNAS